MASYFPHNHSCSQDHITCLISAAVRAVEFLRRMQGGKMSIFSELHLPSLTSERRVVQISKKVLEHLPVGSQQSRCLSAMTILQRCCQAISTLDPISPWRCVQAIVLMARVTVGGHETLVCSSELLQPRIYCAELILVLIWKELAQMAPQGNNKMS